MILSLKELEFDLEHIKAILDKQCQFETGGQLAASMLKDLNSRLDEINSQVVHYRQIRDNLAQAISSLCECLPCELRQEERLCLTCEVLQKETRACVQFFHIQSTSGPVRQ